MRDRSKAQSHFRAGYEPGSVMSGMTLAQRREFYEWQRRRNADSHAYERSLGGTAPREKSRNTHET